MRIAFVLWGGHLGGAERHTIEIARVMRHELGIDARVLFIEQAGISSDVLSELSIPFEQLGLSRGRSVLHSPRRVANAVRDCGRDVAFLGYGGYLARAVRSGGYKGALVSVEHGGVLQVPRWTQSKKVKEQVSRALGERALDATVCVSGLVERIVMNRIHAPRVVVIYNGVDTARYRPISTARAGTCVIGHAGRLIEGKGILNCIRALAGPLVESGTRLIIAGEGPARSRAEALAAELGVAHAVDFRGMVRDMPAFWRECDIVAHPTTEDWKESFCLSVVEAMATGLPAVVSDVGALPEIVVDGVCGAVVPSSDADALRAALQKYCRDDGLRANHGRAARERAVADFDLRRAAREYAAFAEAIRR